MEVRIFIASIIKDNPGDLGLGGFSQPFLISKFQYPKITQLHLVNVAYLSVLERRLPVISSSKFGRRLFDSDEYIFFKVKATQLVY